MSGKKAREARRYARSRERVFDQAFAQQVPWWIVLIEKAMPMRNIRQPLEQIFKGPLTRWREKRAKTNEAYKQRSMKIMARIAKRLMQGTTR
jgi:hypothetical protein